MPSQKLSAWITSSSRLWLTSCLVSETSLFSPQCGFSASLELILVRKQTGSCTCATGIRTLIAKATHEMLRELGDYFGILMDERVTSFPFNVNENPMYNGTVMIFMGTAIWYVDRTRI